eukprot:CAMPEP_0197493808 /NCGR_PEP_ID=MMETSP1311-20131121/24854_1 /TAXON_ID=464262 /ORGANISM="Genus nov. species nov., Strain RCC856" /LENGTH=317 /DNA_ID=CAMNT_0043039109 /DNA_START=615 /DNA_END=1565 /DNA_ORIENTATION=+
MSSINPSLARSVACRRPNSFGQAHSALENFVGVSSLEAVPPVVLLDLAGGQVRVLGQDQSLRELDVGPGDRHGLALRAAALAFEVEGKGVGEGGDLQQAAVRADLDDAAAAVEPEALPFERRHQVVDLIRLRQVVHGDGGVVQAVAVRQRPGRVLADLRERVVVLLRGDGPGQRAHGAGEEEVVQVRRRLLRVLADDGLHLVREGFDLELRNEDPRELYHGRGEPVRVQLLLLELEVVALLVPEVLERLAERVDAAPVDAEGPEGEVVEVEVPVFLLVLEKGHRAPRGRRVLPVSRQEAIEAAHEDGRSPLSRYLPR